MQSEIAIFFFFVVQVIFNICIMQKTDRIEEHITNHKNMISVLNDRLTLHSGVLFRKQKENIKGE